jgi:hypothetical protein
MLKTTLKEMKRKDLLTKEKYIENIIEATM